MMSLQNNVEQLKERLSKACQASERSCSNLHVLAVTKSVDSLKARPLVDLGFTEFAENRVEELLEKQVNLKDLPIKWHLIGTLQRRKVKEIINKIDYFHALDNERLAVEIQKRATRPLKCFVQVNVSGEESKQGVSIAETTDFIAKLVQFDKIEVVGLMTMAPYKADEAVIFEYFTQLAHKRDEIAALNLEHAPCTELSMGMSQDYQMAIQAGATYLRIGTAFFKE